jgi:hypothetical protein
MICDECGGEIFDGSSCIACGLCNDELLIEDKRELPRIIHDEGTLRFEDIGNEIFYPAKRTRGPRGYLKKYQNALDKKERTINKGVTAIQAKCASLDYVAVRGIIEVWKHAWKKRDGRMSNVIMHALACTFLEMRRRGVNIPLDDFLDGTEFTEKRFKGYFKYFPPVAWRESNEELAMNLLEDIEFPEVWRETFTKEMTEKMDEIKIGRGRLRAITALYLVNRRHRVILIKGEPMGTSRMSTHFGYAENAMRRLIKKSGVRKD